MRFIFGLVMVLGTSACGGRVHHTRALRQHAREPADTRVIQARVIDFQASFKTIERLLVGPGYVPGTLAGRLPLDDQKARQIRADLKSEGVYRGDRFRVPVAALYGRHLHGVGQDAQPGSKSLLETVDTVFGDGKTLLEAWREFDRVRQLRVAAERRIYALKAKEAKTPNASKHDAKMLKAEIKGAYFQRTLREELVERAAKRLEAACAGLRLHRRTESARMVVDDLVAVLSVGARVSTEIAAVAPIVTRQAYSAMGGKPTDATLEAALALHALDAHAHTSTEGLLIMAHHAAAEAQVALDTTAGYRLRESAADHLHGAGGDNVSLDFRVGAEMMFFSHSRESGSQFDTSTQGRRLEYDVEPIVLAAFSLNLGFDLLGRPDLLQLSLGYQTDRLAGSGGRLDRGRDALEALGLEGSASDLVSAGLSLAGVRTQVEVAQFHQGRARLIDVPNDTVVGTSPLTLERLKVDFTYNLLMALDEPIIAGWLDNLDVGLRYMRYALPRIAYRWGARTGGDGRTRNVVIAESDPQVMETEAYQAGLMARGAWNISERWRMPLAVGVYFGVGPTQYRPEPQAARETDILGVVTFPLMTGLAYTFTAPQSELQVDLQLAYNLEIIGITPVEDLLGDEDDPDPNESVFGGTDFFHGPLAQLTVGF